MEKKRLKHLHRQFSNELQNLEAEILHSKRQREFDGSEISDGYLSPLEDTESISSEVFGMPDEVVRGQGKRLMPRVDENREMASFHHPTRYVLLLYAYITAKS